MQSKRHIHIVTIMILCLGLALTLPAQQGRGKGRIRGTVEDTEGNPLKDVKIVAIHLEYNTQFDGKSNKKGNWAIGGMGTGLFRFTATLEGYEPSSQDIKVSQFSANNVPLAFTLRKVQPVSTAAEFPGLEDESSISIFEEGNQLYSEKKYAEAAAKFQEFLSLNPGMYQVSINLANCYQEMGDYEQALTVYNTLLNKITENNGTLEGDERAARALAGIGQTYMKSGDMVKAREYWQQAMTAFPKDESLAFNIGEIYFTQQETEKAIEYYKKAIEINPNWAPPYRQLGYAYLNKAEYQSALDSFKKFLKVGPDDPLAPTIENLLPTLQGLIKK